MRVFNNNYPLVSDKKIRQGKNRIENSLVVAKFVIDKKQKRAMDKTTKFSGQPIIKQVLSFIDNKIIYRTAIINDTYKSLILQSYCNIFSYTKIGPIN